MTFLERLRNIIADWNGEPREVRHTAIGWDPGGSYQEDCGCTPSGEREFYIVVRDAPKQQEQKDHERR
jgi:hypothetical protein